MPYPMKKNTALRNKTANDFAAMWDSGTISVYGRIDPANDPLILLLEYPLGAQAFDAAVDGKISLHDDSTGVALGVGAGIAEVATLRSASPGEYEIEGFTVGTEDAHIIINNVSVDIDQPVTLNKFDWTEKEFMKFKPNT